MSKCELFFSYNILTSSVIYCCLAARQHEIYFLNIHTDFSVREMFLDTLLLRSDAIGDDEGVVTVVGSGNEDNDDADDDDCESDDAEATDTVMVVMDKMLLDSSLSSVSIGDDEGIGAVGDSGNEGAAVFKDDTDNDDNDDDCESNDAEATDFVMVVIDEDGDRDNTSVDCSSGVPVCGMWNRIVKI